MTIQVAAFRWVPPFAQGFVRDLRIRWALEEAGWPYEIELIDFERAKSPEYRGWQPFRGHPAASGGALGSAGAVRSGRTGADHDLGDRGAQLDRALHPEVH
jgi:hypothetical protein